MPLSSVRTSPIGDSGLLFPVVSLVVTVPVYRARTGAMLGLGEDVFSSACHPRS